MGLLKHHPICRCYKRHLFQVAPGRQSTDQQHRQQQREARLGHDEDPEIPWGRRRRGSTVAIFYNGNKKGK